MNRREFRIGPGAASLMLIVVTLSMSVLGMLSLMNARSDVNLGERSIAVAQQVYELSNEAQRTMSELDALLVSCAKGATGEEDYLERIRAGLNAEMTLTERTVSWSEQRGDRTLDCEAEIAPLRAFPRCRFTQHRLRTALDEFDGMEFEDEWN